MITNNDKYYKPSCHRIKYVLITLIQIKKQTFDDFNTHIQ